jgi:hypothetical protein
MPDTPIHHPAYGLGLGPSQAEAKRSGRRFTYRLCHEAGHFLQEEQKRRMSLGLPHTSISDILNDWVLEHAKCLKRETLAESITSDEVFAKWLQPRCEDPVG